MVNPVHPDTPHISAVRAWRFAQELAVLGHCVVFLTAPLPGKPPASGAPLTGHDWTQPHVLEIDGCAQSQAVLPAPFRKLRTAWRLFMAGGARGRWVRNGVRAVQQQLPQFRPDVVWCTFGMMEAVFAAKRIAKLAACPWVLDIKDNWELYVPRGLRRLMVWRTHGWAAVTANAEFTAKQAKLWQYADSCVIYSGVDDAFLTQVHTAQDNDQRINITLVGSLYFPDCLDALLNGIQLWSENLTPLERQRISICYLGGDIEMFQRAVQRRITGICAGARGYIPAIALAKICRASTVNVYVAHAGGFHHKLLELLACERPILVYPAESDESRLLVKEAGGELFEATGPDHVAGLLAQICSRRLHAATDRTKCKTHRRYSWADQTLQLERVLLRAISTNAKND